MHPRIVILTLLTNIILQTQTMHFKMRLVKFQLWDVATLFAQMHGTPYLWKLRYAEQGCAILSLESLRHKRIKLLVLYC